MRLCHDRPIPVRADPGNGRLSEYADESYAVKLFRNGDAGLAYLLNDRVGDLHHLLSALRDVAAGGSVIDPKVVEALVGRRARLRESPLAMVGAPGRGYPKRS